MNAQMSPSIDASKVEAARYALIRRLGFVFRHHLVVNLQPLNMICHVMQRRLAVTPFEVSSMRESVDQVNRLVRTSIDSCLDVVSWLTADPQLTVAVGKAVNECLSNLRSSFSFRGFVVHYQESSLEMDVSQIAVREVLTAALLAASDHANGLNAIVIALLAERRYVEISIQLRRGLNESTAEQDAYRLIGWDDVQVLASSHGLRFIRVADDLMKIQIPHFAIASVE